LQAFFEDLYDMENSNCLNYKGNQKLILIVKEQQMQKILLNRPAASPKFLVVFFLSTGFPKVNPPEIQ